MATHGGPIGDARDSEIRLIGKFHRLRGIRSPFRGLRSGLLRNRNRYPAAHQGRYDGEKWPGTPAIPGCKQTRPYKGTVHEENPTSL
jgi:hypothetical protein